MKASSEGLVGAVELAANCDRLAVGFFGFGTAVTSGGATGSTRGDNNGFGGYLRVAGAAGFYATGLTAISWSNAKVANSVLESTAETAASGVTGFASVGYAPRLNAISGLDMRAFVSYNANATNPFTDTAGITVTSSKSNILSYGASIGYVHQFNASLQGFARAGVKWAALDNSMVVFDNLMTGSAKDVAGTFEAGLNGTFANGVFGQVTLGVKF
jgi:hypothetical protein